MPAGRWNRGANHGLGGRWAQPAPLQKVSTTIDRARPPESASLPKHIAAKMESTEESDPSSRFDIYRAGISIPEDLIRTISAAPTKPDTPPKPSYGLDSPGGLLASNITFPLYLYASLHGKFQVWDDILSKVPDHVFVHPSLDVGCGRGMVLLKVAQRKSALNGNTTAAADVKTDTAPPAAKAHRRCDPAFGIDIFSSQDQPGNAPLATYANAAALGVTAEVVLHRASFTETFPFADDVFGLVTASLSLHNVGEAERAAAVREMARVCRPEGRVVIVDLFGTATYADVLKQEGFEVQVRGAGMILMYGIFPCRVVVAVKPGGGGS